MKYGADAVVDPSSCDVVEEIMSLTGAGGSVVVKHRAKIRLLFRSLKWPAMVPGLGLIGHSIGRKIPWK